ncbi:hypothetical protein Bbelb_020150 [Branchiostoma belcheri]|nr:hypothetical protein Bbelb_020150 [Branchiostoma belcheri]
MSLISLDPNFSPFLANGFTWRKKSAGVENRGLTADGEAVPQAKHHTAPQKAASLELMLGRIANFCPVISRNRIVKAREITHHGDGHITEEAVTPSLENFIVLLWLKLLHPALPALVKQRYGSELRHKTLASIKPELSLALQSLMDELQTTEDVRTLRLSQGRDQYRSDNNITLGHHRPDLTIKCAPSALNPVSHEPTTSSASARTSQTQTNSICSEPDEPSHQRTLPHHIELNNSHPGRQQTH